MSRKESRRYRCLTRGLYKLLFIGWEDAFSTLRISAAVAQVDYRSGDALEKLGPLPPGLLMKVKVKMRLLLVDPRLQES